MNTHEPLDWTQPGKNFWRAEMSPGVLFHATRVERRDVSAKGRYTYHPDGWKLEAWITMGRRAWKIKVGHRRGRNALGNCKKEAERFADVLRQASGKDAK